MKRLEKKFELQNLRKELQGKRNPDEIRVRVCMTGCRARGADQVAERFRKLMEKPGVKDRAVLVETGCHGFCAKAPVVEIEPSGIFYGEVTPDDVPEIIEKTVMKGEIIERLNYKDPQTGKSIPMAKDIPFYRGQERVVLRNLGKINPRRIEDYIEKGGYLGMARALKKLSPSGVIDEMEASGLRGRGGAGFPTFLKWRLTRKERSKQKYVICNGDEGDPGAFMDRGVMEGNPHCVIEGMVIGGYAIGASQGFIYVRAEYPIAVEHLSIAIDSAREMGLLGKNILGSGFDFDLEIREGAGAFVCGEETALIASIEGKRGTPRSRPPYPSVAGLWGKPTSINNAETFANVTIILGQGPKVYASHGHGTSRGTKVFSLAGKLNNTGLVEVPMGITLRELIFDLGGGMANNKKFKAIQMGGPSGGCLTEEYLDIPVTYDSLAEIGAIMGSGGVIALDEDTCMVDIARYFLAFSASESCGECTPCRVGTTRMLEILERICGGRGKMDDLDTLEKLAKTIKDASLCGLGQNAPNPILSTLKYFRHEYIEHIETKKCPTGVCKRRPVDKAAQRG
jgi:NADH-quinone oxidoreductase subunit F/NADP-reducing hydrogenase subunit HndC